MIQDDPFAEADVERTILKPVPGGFTQNRKIDKKDRTHRPSSLTEQLPQRNFDQEFVNRAKSRAENWNHYSGLTPLVTAAAPMLSFGHLMRNSIQQIDADALKNELIEKINKFESYANSLGCEENSILTGRYILCSYLDESVLSTPWGCESNWSAKPLLVLFHKDSWGGEKFFTLLERLLAQPNNNRELLQLMQLCLAFGFKGKYGVDKQGQYALKQIEHEIAQTLQRGKPRSDNALSSNWRGEKTRAPRLAKFIPPWVIVAITALLLLLIYSGYSYTINSSTEPLIERIEKLII